MSRTRRTLKSYLELTPENVRLAADSWVFASAALVGVGHCPMWILWSSILAKFLSSFFRKK